MSIDSERCNCAWNPVIGWMQCATCRSPEPMKTDDRVCYDESVGVVISRRMSSSHSGHDCDVRWDETGNVTTVWESDLLPAEVNP